VPGSGGVGGMGSVLALPCRRAPLEMASGPEPSSGPLRFSVGLGWCIESRAAGSRGGVRGVRCGSHEVQGSPRGRSLATGMVRVGSGGATGIEGAPSSGAARVPSFDLSSRVYMVVPSSGVDSSTASAAEVRAASAALLRASNQGDAKAGRRSVGSALSPRCRRWRPAPSRLLPWTPSKRMPPGARRRARVPKSRAGQHVAASGAGGAEARRRPFASPLAQRELSSARGGTKTRRPWRL
jgi:hypothetical protein